MNLGLAKMLDRVLGGMAGRVDRLRRRRPGVGAAARDPSTRSRTSWS